VVRGVRGTLGAGAGVAPGNWLVYRYPPTAGLTVACSSASRGSASTCAAPWLFFVVFFFFFFSSLLDRCASVDIRSEPVPLRPRQLGPPPIPPSAHYCSPALPCYRAKANSGLASHAQQYPRLQYTITVDAAKLQLDASPTLPIRLAPSTSWDLLAQPPKTIVSTTEHTNSQPGIRPIAPAHGSRGPL
jgi:hypothetical protein